MSTDRDALASRILPFMTLSNAEAPDSLTKPPPPLPKTLTPAERAAARFQVEVNVVITGGAGTLALSTARALLEHGCTGLCLWDLESTLRASQPGIASLAATFPSARIFSCTVDVTSPASIAEGTETAVKALGSIDHLFCFAGIVGCFHALEMTPEQWRSTLDVNTTGAYLCAQAVARHIASRPTTTTTTAGPTFPAGPAGGCSITFTSSISAHRTNYPQPQAAYNASKAALLSLKSSLAAEWAVHGIRVNSISPGYMDTVLNAGEGRIKEARGVWAERNPMGRMGAIGELDGICILLASRAGSYINGADFVVDGGACCF